MDAAGKFRSIHRFDQVRGETTGERPPDFLIETAAGESNGWNCRQFWHPANALNELNPIGVRHPHIGNDHVRTVVFRGLNCPFRTRSDIDGISLPFEFDSKNEQDILRIID